jgi:predicted GNAT family N-acyltransferase
MSVIVVRRARPEELERCIAVRREVFVAEQGVPAEEEIDGRDARCLHFIALAGDEVVGYAKLSLTAAQPTVAFHDITGVKRAWRGRCVASALKRAEIAWAKWNGYERLSTMNEERNEPIRRLNARLGYRPAPGEIYLEGPLSRTG